MTGLIECGYYGDGGIEDDSDGWADNYVLTEKLITGAKAEQFEVQRQ